MIYKVVFFDVDGTLLTSRGELLESTKSSIKELDRRGLTVVLASARPPFNMQNLLEELGITTFISFNGSLVIHQGLRIYQQSVAPEIVKRVKEVCKERKESLIVSTDTGFDILSENPEHVIEQYLTGWNLKKRAAGIEDEGNIYQMEIVCNKDSICTYSQQFPTLSFYPWSKRECTYNASPHTVSKANGVQVILQVLNFKDTDAIAFGDGVNDIAMISSVGMGVAMGNAADELKQQADLVTENADDDGIYYGLKRLNVI